MKYVMAYSACFVVQYHCLVVHSVLDAYAMDFSPLLIHLTQHHSYGMVASMYIQNEIFPLAHIVKHGDLH